MCSNQLYQLSSSSLSIYMESLNRSELPLEGSKGRPYAYDDLAQSEDVGTVYVDSLNNLQLPMRDRPCDDEVKSEEVKKEIKRFQPMEEDMQNVTATKKVAKEEEIGSNQISQLSSPSHSIYLGSFGRSQLPLRKLKIEITRLNLGTGTPDEGSIKEAVEREIARVRNAKEQSRHKEKLKQEKEDAIEKIKNKILDEEGKKAAARREAARLRRESGRLRTAKYRAKKKLEQDYQESIEDDDIDDNYSIGAEFPNEDLKEEIEGDDPTKKADARREIERLKKAKQRARDKEWLDRELVAPDHEVPETALVRKALIKEIERHPRLWNRTISPKGAKANDWRQILEQLQVTFESSPGIMVRCRAASTEKLRHIWYRLYNQHNLTWKRNGWKDSGTDLVLNQCPYWEDAGFIRKLGPPEESECDSELSPKDPRRAPTIWRADGEVKLRKELLRQVKSHPRLWDITHAEYRNREGRRNDWQSIFERLQDKYVSNREILVKCRADNATRLRKTWHVLSTHHNIIWKRNGWKDSYANLNGQSPWPYWEVFEFYRQNGPSDDIYVMRMNKKPIRFRKFVPSKTEDDIRVRNTLIKEVKDYPSLWDNNHPHFKKMVLRNYDFQDVMDKLREAFKTNANILTECGADSVRKIRHIWVCLLKRHNEIWNSNETIDRDARIKDWPYWEAFQYVRQPRDTVNSDPGGQTRWLECGQCPFKVIHIDSKSSHEMNNHRWKYHKGFFCEYCAYGTHIKQHFTDHVNAVHYKKKTHTCDECGYVTGYYSNLLHHKKKHEGYKSKRKRRAPSEWICDQCGCKFYQRNQLREHIDAKHMGKKPYQCKLCDFAAGFRTNLYAHMRKTHGTRVGRATSREGKWFKDTSLKWEDKAKNLNEFLRSNNFDEVKQDAKVDASVPHLGSQNHMIEGTEQESIDFEETHDKPKESICDQCGAAYVNKRDLWKHIRIHHSTIKDTVGELSQEENELPYEEGKNAADKSPYSPSESKEKGVSSEQSDKHWSLGQSSNELDQEDVKLPSMIEEKMDTSSSNEELEVAHQEPRHGEDVGIDDIGLNDVDIDDGQIEDTGDCDDFDITGLDELVFLNGPEKETNQPKNEEMPPLKDNAMEPEENTEGTDFADFDTALAADDPHSEPEKAHKNEAQEGAEFFQCEMCGYESADRKSVADHKKSVHESIIDSICDDCGRAFIDPQTKKEHVGAVHGTVKERRRSNVEKSELMEDVIENEVSLMNKEDRSNDDKKPEVIKIEPDFVHAIGDDEVALSFDECKSKEDVLKEMHDTQDDHNDFFPCLLCGKTYSLKQSLTRHLDRDHCNKRFSCQYCDKIFTNSFYFKRHVEREHESNDATQPKEEASSESYEEDAQDSVSEINNDEIPEQKLPMDGQERSDEEEQCNGVNVNIPSLVKLKSSSADNVLKRENQVEEETSRKESGRTKKLRKSFKNEGEFACDTVDCGYRSKWSGNLRLHCKDQSHYASCLNSKKLRSGKKRKDEGEFACDTVDCGYRSKWRGNLRLHCKNQSHHASCLSPADEEDSKKVGENAQVPNGGRNRKRRRKRVKKEPHQSTVCEECGKSFKRREKLEVHKKTVHQKITNFQCDHCPMAFFYKNQRDQHVQRVHLKIKDTGTSSRIPHSLILSLSTLSSYLTFLIQVH